MPPFDVTQESLQAVWQRALGSLEEQLGTVEVDAWLRGSQLTELDGQNACLCVPSQLHSEQLQRKHLSAICRSLNVDACRVEVREVEIDYALPDDDDTPAAPPPSRPTASAADPDAPPSLRPSAPQLNARYVFENYVVGPCNRFAHAAAVGVAENPSTNFNPLFLHGSVGLGKTHLAQAVAHRLLETDPGRRILYLSCEEFVNHYVSAIQQGSVNPFRERYRHTDVLIVDDIHVLANKQRTQEEFFHTFNALHNAGAQIVLSSDAPPEDIPDLQDRLVSRFKWGLVAELPPPAYETRVAILQRKAEEYGIELGDEVARFIAEHIENNVRELEGTLTKLRTLCMVEDKPISMGLARRALGSSLNGVRQRVVRMDDIIETVTGHYSVGIAELQSKRRNHSIVLPRQVSMFLARRLTDHSLEEIGGFFGGRDHSTVVYAVERIEKRRRVDGDFGALLTELERRVREGGGRSR